MLGFGAFLGVSSAFFGMESHAEPLHLTYTFQEKNAYLSSIQRKDISFMKTLFANEAFMKFLTNGKPRAPEDMEKRCFDAISRFEKGYPDGYFILFFEDRPCGYAICDPGDAKGSGDLGFGILPEHQNKGLGTKLFEQLVRTLVPEIQKKKINCYNGDPLKFLEATCSPANVYSWKIIERFLKNGTLAQNRLETMPCLHDFFEQKFSFEGLNLSQKYEIVEDRLNKLFLEKNLPANVVYKIHDLEGNARAVSMHGAYGRLKYHFYLNLGE